MPLTKILKIQEDKEKIRRTKEHKFVVGMIAK